MSIDVTEGTIPTWSVADRLRKAREHAGLEQGQLADLIGISRNSVSNYERGARTARRPVLVSWALATGVPLAWLEHGQAPNAKNPHPDGPGGGHSLPRLDSNQQPAGYLFAQVREGLTAA